MPHITVKLHPGRTEAQKAQLAEEMTRDVIDILKCRTEAVSISIEEVSPEDWAEQVYKPDIAAHPDTLYKKPGYNPFA